MSTADGNEFHTATANGNNVIRITADGNVVFRSRPIDNFEDNAYSDFYEPESSGASITQASAYRGNYGLDFPESATTETVSMPNELQVSGQNQSLLNHFQQGDTATLFFNLQTWDQSGSLADISFANQWQNSSADQYRIYLTQEDPDISFELIEVTDGSTTVMASGTWSSWTTGDWYQIDIEWTMNDEFSADLIDPSDGSTILSIGPAQPFLNTFRGGGIAWWTNTNTGIYVDDWVITDRSDSTDYGSWWFSAPSDETNTTTEFQGVVVEPLVSTLNGIEAWVDWDTNANRCLLYEYDPDADSSTIIATETGITGGAWVTYDTVTLDSAYDYWLGCDADGSEYTRARGNFSRPTDSEYFALTNGIYNDSPSHPANEYRYNIRTVRVIE